MREYLPHELSGGACVRAWQRTHGHHPLRVGTYSSKIGRSAQVDCRCGRQLGKLEHCAQSATRHPFDQ
jgi:hypothetical protein